MSRTLRWPTLEEAIRITAQRIYFTAKANGFSHALHKAVQLSRQLTVAACDPYEVYPSPKEFQHFYNPETNSYYKAHFFQSDYLKCWVWSNTDFNLGDHPILEFHHDVYLNTIGSP